MILQHCLNLSGTKRILKTITSPVLTGLEMHFGVVRVYSVNSARGVIAGAFYDGQVET